MRERASQIILVCCQCQMAYTGNFSLIRDLFVFSLVLSFKYLCLLYIINVILSFLKKLYDAISSSFK